MKAEVEKFEKTSFITILNGNFEVVLSDLGASIFSIKLDDTYMTQTFKHKEDFLLPRKYHGKTIGRVTNRIAGNKVNIDGQEYELENNEGPNVLHGGVHGLSTVIFDYDIIEMEDETVVTFKHVSKKKESGFPGKLNVNVTYRIRENEVLIKYNCVSDTKTMCSLTNHAFYSLGENSLDNLELRIAASYFLHPNPKDLLPVEVRDVTDVMDFRKFKSITKCINNDYLLESKSKGYDHYYYFDKKDENIAQVSLKGNKYLLDIYTSFGGTQIYSDNYVDQFEFHNAFNSFRRGIAIEPSESQKDFHYLDKGEEYNKFIKLVFSKI